MNTQVLTRPAETGNDPAELVQLKQQLEGRAAEFRKVLPPHIDPDKFLRTVITAVQLNPELLRTDRRSFLNACMKSAQDGLLPDGREAVIVAYKTRRKDPELGWLDVWVAQYQPMVFGLRKKILQSGEVADLFVQVVYKQELDAGRFIYEEGSERTLRHKPILELDFRPTDDDIALAYSIATLSNGLKSFEIMRRWEIDDIREASQTGATLDRNGQPRESKGPWVLWFAEMAKKSVVRRHAKSLPQSSDITDVEAEDLAIAARNAAALLSSPQAEPQRLLGNGDAFESDGMRTGLGRTGTDQATPRPEPEPEPDPDPVSTERPPRSEPGPTPEPEAEPEPEPEPEAASFPDDEEGMTAAVDEAERQRGERIAEEVPIEEQPVDATGVSKPASQILAEAAIKRINATVLLMDLTKVERELAAELIGLPADAIAAVDEAIDLHRTRLENLRPKQ